MPPNVFSLTTKKVKRADFTNVFDSSENEITTIITIQLWVPASYENLGPRVGGLAMAVGWLYSFVSI